MNLNDPDIIICPRSIGKWLQECAENEQKKNHWIRLSFIGDPIRFHRSSYFIQSINCFAHFRANYKNNIFYQIYFYFQKHFSSHSISIFGMMAFCVNTQVAHNFWSIDHLKSTNIFYIDIKLQWCWLWLCSIRL